MRPNWPPGPQAAKLQSADVHIWQASLESDTETAKALFEVLDAGEQERANRFAFAYLRHRFVVAHGFVRDVLRRYVWVGANRIEIRTGAHGKPYLRYPVMSALHFNLSHTDEVALCGVGVVPVGVDVEAVRPVRDLDALAQSCFGVWERQALADTHDRESAFFRFWTRKEAVIKAIGTGLSIPLVSFDVIPAAQQGLTAHVDGRTFHVTDLELPEGYAASLATESEPSLRFWSWTAPA